MLPLAPYIAVPLQRILCLGAHCDDVEIGCGATLKQLLRHFPDAEVQACIFTGDERREAETRNALGRILESCRSSKVSVCRFRNGYFPSVAGEIKDHLESYKLFDPQLIFTHYRHDHHQDHRTISELTSNTFRNHFVLEYEILKYDGDLANPNVFVPITADDLSYKVSVLMECFESQSDKQWFTQDGFQAMARIRGVQGASPTGLAEAFYATKLTLAF